MIISFYDKNFTAISDNSSLVVDINSFNLKKRPIELNEFSCLCEPFNEDIQPTFLVVKDNYGRYVYGSLAGVPLINQENKTEINASDLRSMLSSDVILEPQGSITTVNGYIQYIFNTWNTDVNQGSFTCELEFNDNVGTISLGDLGQVTEKGIYNALEELQNILNYYKLYMDTFIDLQNKKIKFIIGKLMDRNYKIKLWEYGLKNYGKWLSDINECQGYDKNWNAGYKWILTSNNRIFTTSYNPDNLNRDIYPIKRKIVQAETVTDANKEALTQLIEAMYNEDIQITAENIEPYINNLLDAYVGGNRYTNKTRLYFETNFEVYTRKGGGKYKDLPCGEITYNGLDVSGLQIGCRYTTVDFI